MVILFLPLAWQTEVDLLPFCSMFFLHFFKPYLFHEMTLKVMFWKTNPPKKAVSWHWHLLLIDTTLLWKRYNSGNEKKTGFCKTLYFWGMKKRHLTRRLTQSRPMEFAKNMTIFSQLQRSFVLTWWWLKFIGITHLVNILISQWDLTLWKEFDMAFDMEIGQNIWLCIWYSPV